MRAQRRKRNQFPRVERARHVLYMDAYTLLTIVYSMLLNFNCLSHLARERMIIHRQNGRVRFSRNYSYVL